jgi:hypothetical protein
MFRLTRNALLLVFLLGGLAGCNTDPVSPEDGDPIQEELTLSADLEVQVASDADVADVAIEDAALSVGSPPSATDGPFAAAREKFGEAREAMAAGDTVRARELARDARILMVQAMIDARGEEAVEHLFSRVERLLERMGEASDEFDQLQRLTDRIGALYDEAVQYRDGGDMTAAGERLLLALQMTDRMRHRHRDFRLDPQQHARLALARAGHAIQLANRILGDDMSPRQAEVLERAVGMFEPAQVAFDEGRYRRSVILSRRVEGLCLFAVLEGEPPTVEEAGQLLQLAETLIAEAHAAIGDAPTPAQEMILQRAVHLKNMGARAINTWHWRGVALLWHSAVTAAILL